MKSKKSFDRGKTVTQMRMQLKEIDSEAKRKLMTMTGLFR